MSKKTRVVERQCDICLYDLKGNAWLHFPRCFGWGWFGHPNRDRYPTDVCQDCWLEIRKKRLAEPSKEKEKS